MTDAAAVNPTPEDEMECDAPDCVCLSCRSLQVQVPVAPVILWDMCMLTALAASETLSSDVPLTDGTFRLGCCCQTCRNTGGDSEARLKLRKCAGCQLAR